MKAFMVVFALACVALANSAPADNGAKAIAVNLPEALNDNIDPAFGQQHAGDQAVPVNPEVLILDPTFGQPSVGNGEFVLPNPDPFFGQPTVDQQANNRYPAKQYDSPLLRSAKGSQ